MKITCTKLIQTWGNIYPLYEAVDAVTGFRAKGTTHIQAISNLLGLIYLRQYDYQTLIK